MTGYMLKKRLRASGTKVSEDLYVSAAHPEDGPKGCLIQSELDDHNKRDTGRRFHCFQLSAEQIPALVRALRKAERHFKSISKKYHADMAKAEAARHA